MVERVELTVAIQSLNLDLPPSCIEFCPAHPDYFLVGTYYLEVDEGRAQGDLTRPQHRNGTIVVFRLGNDKKVHCLETVAHPSAILDLHFQQASGRQDVFAVASSTATLSVFRLAPSSQGDSGFIEPLSTIRIPEVGDGVLFLSCSWHPTVPDLIALTTSTGSVYVVGLQQTQRPGSLPTEPVILHELESWTVAFSPTLQEALSQPDGGWTKLDSSTGPQSASDRHGKDRTNYAGAVGNISTIYSGGDDSTLRYTSCVVRAPAAAAAASQKVFDAIQLRGHEAGVTAILPTTIAGPDGGEIVVTGSYDDRIRVYSIQSPLDTYGMQQAKCLAEKNLGGGVWRLKLVEQTTLESGRAWKLRVLASCMHAGVRVVGIEGGHGRDCRISVVARFEDHKSMNYGSDFRPGASLLCVSTSFYDKLLCLWEIANDQDKAP